MTEPEADAYRRLGMRVRDRRKRLGLSQHDVQARGGPSTATLRQIENGRPMSYRRGTTWPLEQILGWEAGSVEAILAGGEPTPVHEAAAAPVGSGVDPALLADLDQLDPAAVEKVRAYVRGLKDGAG